MKGILIFLESAVADTSADAGEEVVYDVVVVQLEEDPAEHFFCVEKVSEVSAVVVCARVACTIRGQWGERGGEG